MARFTRPVDGENDDVTADLARRMRSPRSQERSLAVERAHYLATRQTDVDLSTLVPVLVDMYAGDDEDRLRLCAVATLYAMKNEAGMRAVARHLPDQTDRYVQIISIAALRDYFEMDSTFSSEDVATMSMAVLESLQASEGRSPPDP